MKVKVNRKSAKLTFSIIGAFLLLAVCARITDRALPVSAPAAEKPVIVLDAGHGGMDSGAVGVTGVLEKDVNLSIVLMLRDMFEMSGFEVVLTRDKDISIYDDGVEGIRNQKLNDMDNRLKIIQSYPDSLFLCIHQNNYTDPRYFGGQMFYNNNNPNNRTLAQIMQNKFAELQEGNDREIKLTGNELFLLKSNKNPSLMIECGFLSNPEEEQNLASREYQQKVAFTVFSGVMEYFDATAQRPSEFDEDSQDEPSQNITSEQSDSETG